MSTLTIVTEDTTTVGMTGATSAIRVSKATPTGTTADIIIVTVTMIGVGLGATGMRSHRF